MMYISMRDYLPLVGKDQFVGYENFASALVDPKLIDSLSFTLGMLGAALSIELALGIVLAALVSTLGRSGRLVTGILLLPTMITPAIVGLIWSYMFQMTGPINQIVSYFHEPLPFLSDMTMARLSILFTDVWQWTPFTFLIVYAGLMSLPNEPFEAAQIDGASKLQVWSQIRLPLLRGPIVVAALLRASDLFRMFDTIAVMTRGGPYLEATTSTSYYIYNLAFKFFNLGYASSVALVFLVVASLFITGLQRTLTRRQRS